LPFRKQNSPRWVSGCDRFLLQSIGQDGRKIAKGLVCWYNFLGVVYDMSRHECLRLQAYSGKSVTNRFQQVTFAREAPNKTN
jgi:hypothetical protein